MNVFGFILWNFMIMLFYIFALGGLFYSKDIRSKILEELEKDGLLGGYSYLRHKWTHPGLAKIIGFIMIVAFAFFAIETLTGDINNKLSLFIAIPLLAFNTFMHQKIGLYLIRTGRKIKEGDKKTIFGEIETAVTFGSIPENAFWIYLAIAYVLNIATLLKIIF